MEREFQPLRPDDAIGVVALSGPAERDALESGLGELQGWGHPVVTAPNLYHRTGYLAGDDDERLSGLEWVLDRGVRVVIALRGGFGSTRLLSRLPWSRLTEDGVTFVGFSDLTAVMNPLVSRGGAIQVHGPMVTGGVGDPRNGGRLRSLLSGHLVGKPLFRIPDPSVVTPGRVRGPSMGGNLSLLCALQGTPFAPDLDGCILFLEDVNEPLYRLDRMLTHLVCSGTLQRVKALISGSLRGCRPAAGRSERWRKLVAGAVPSGVPVVVDLPFGHGSVNQAFPIGATIELDTDSGLVTWSG
jgi:muramoyltetrapeptide carboxypeptidase